MVGSKKDSFFHYMTGHENMDREHHIIVLKKEEVEKLVRNHFLNKDFREAIVSLEDLIKLILAHHQYEEDLMKSSGYPDGRARSHKENHKTLIRKISVFKYDLEQNPWSVFKQQWIGGLDSLVNHHLIDYDQRFGEWLKENLVSGGS